MKIKRLITILVSVMLLSSLFATSAFAAGTRPFKETEPNDTQAQADPADFQYPYDENMRVFGAFNQTDSADWYRVMLTDSTYSLVIAFTRFTGTPNCTYELTIYDSNMVQRGQVISTSTTSVYLYDIILRHLTPYYFKVRLISGSPAQPYDFMINVDEAYESLSDITDEALLQKIMEQTEVNEPIEPEAPVEATDANEAH